MIASIYVNRINIYEAFELKQIYFRKFSIGILTAIIPHLLTVSSFRFVPNSKIRWEEKPKIIHIFDLPLQPMDLIPQRSILYYTNSIAPNRIIPLPVTNDDVSQKSSIISQKEYSSTVQPLVYEKIKAIGEIKIDPPKETNEEEEPDSRRFLPYEQAPEPVYSAKVVYPEVALRSGITGIVFLKVLIDKLGKPKRAIVLRSDSELFNQAAIDAAMASAFTPAIQNKQPISVWIDCSIQIYY